MKTVIIQLVTAFLGAFGFSLVYQIRRNLLFWTSLGGMIAWGAYMVLKLFLPGLFWPYMFASVVAGIYSAIMARIQKVPAVTYLLPAVIPSVPGGALFYTMQDVVQKNWNSAFENGNRTLQFALAIAVGISLVWAVEQIILKIKDKKAEKYNIT